MLMISFINVTITFFIILAFCAYNIYYILDLNRPVAELNSHNCRLLKGLIGAEDIIKFGNYLIAPSDDRIKLWEHPDYLANKVSDGGLYLIDPESEKIRKLELNGFPNTVAFHPHGMYFTKTNLLYVINHAYNKGGERVEVFEIDKFFPEFSFDTLKIKYKYSILFDDIHMGRLNDLVVLETGKDEIYITSYLAFADPKNGRDVAVNKFSKLKTFGTLALLLNWSHVYYCNGVNQVNVANCIQIKSERVSSVQNTGIAYDSKNDLLYLVRPLEKEIKLFKIDQDNHSVLHYQGDIKLNHNPDNAFFDEEANAITLGVGGKPLDFFNYIDHSISNTNSNKDVPCWCGAEIVNLNATSIPYKGEVIVMQNDKMCGISSAIIVKSKVFMGSWAAQGVLVCDLVLGSI